MKNLKIAITGIFVISLTLVSCNKYEEGPGVSLLTKKARVANTWKIGQALRNNQDVTNEYDEYTLRLTKDGDANLAALYTAGNFSYETDTDGTWEFENSKENLFLNFQDDDFDNKYQILKLENNEMWIREIGGEDELRLVTK